MICSGAVGVPGEGSAEETSGVGLLPRAEMRSSAVKSSGSAGFLGAEVNDAAGAAARPLPGRAAVHVVDVELAQGPVNALLRSLLRCPPRAVWMYPLPRASCRAAAVLCTRCTRRARAVLCSSTSRKAVVASTVNSAGPAGHSTLPPLTATNPKVTLHQQRWVGTRRHPRLHRRLVSQRGHAAVAGIAGVAGQARGTRTAPGRACALAVSGECGAGASPRAALFEPAAAAPPEVTVMGSDRQPRPNPKP